MNDNMRIKIEELINSKLSMLEKNILLTDCNFPENIKHSLFRMIKAFNLYSKEQKYCNDFEISLRDFLMILKEPLKIDNYNVSNFGKSIGLHEDGSKKWVLQAYPNYIISEFALKAAMTEAIPMQQDNGYNLDTNQFIRTLTGYTSFKSEEQKLCVMGALRAPEGSSLLVSMSTGGGKSLITQTIAFQNEGLTIVIVPTVSLMIDQVKNAKDNITGHKEEIAYYNSSSDCTLICKALTEKKIKLLFLSPEALIKNKILKKVIVDLNSEGWLKNIIVDEAHIIFEWGDSFRLDFQCIDIFRKELRKNNKNFRTLLLSATFTQKNVNLLKQFYSEDDNWIELRCESLRREIRYNFIKSKSFDDKEEKTIELIKILPHPMIVYVERPEEANRIQNVLISNGINNIYTFTGTTSAKDREELITKWKNNDFQIMIATCAFGVGVDKKDVRTVLHLYMPDNINKYYQEAGRGGRDGNSSQSIILYTREDESSAFNFIRRKVLTTEKMKRRWISMMNAASSIKHGNGKVTIDTSVKPDYSDDDECITNPSSRDIDWNVYVLLFLKRHYLIDIEMVDYIANSNNYFMLVKLLNKKLFKDDESLQLLLDKYREEEWNEIEHSYKDMVKFLAKADNQCVSDMYLKQYSLIPYEYCSGCNYHHALIRGAYDGLPLVSRTTFRRSVNELDLIDSPVLILKTNDMNRTENRLIEKGLRTIVLSHANSLIQEGNQTSDCMVFTAEEFVKVLEKNDYFLSNTILIECPEKEAEKEYEIIKTIQLVERVKSKFTVKIILLVKDNYFIQTFHKKLYEMIESTYQEDYTVV